MIRAVRIHGADDAAFVHVRAQFRENLADFDAALAVFLEFERGFEQVAGFALGLQIAVGNRFAVELVEHRLGIESIDLGRAAVQKQEDDVFGAGGKLRRFGRERIGVQGAVDDRRRPASPAKAVIPKPVPNVLRQSRRVIILVHKLKFVRSHQNLSVFGPALFVIASAIRAPRRKSSASFFSSAEGGR